MTLLAGLESFSRLPFWSPLFLVLAAGITVYSGWSLWRSRERADLYYALLGLYLIAVLLPTAVPAVGLALGITCPLSGGLTNRILLVVPVIVLFVLAGRSETTKQHP